MTRTTTLTALALLASAAGLAAVGWPGPVAPAPAQAAQARTEQAPPRAKVIAAKFHADWCGFCKQMGPVFEELQAKYDQQPVLFVELDQTRQFDRRQSAYLAREMGLEGVWERNGGKTGFVLLIDPASGQVVRRLTHDQGLKQMGAALQDAVSNAS